jgi:predicted nucleic acid-binding protein
MLQEHLLRHRWDEVALPSVVIAEVLRGRCDFALKASPSQAPMAHQLLLQTQELLRQFNIVTFDQPSAEIMLRLQQKLKSHKRYADVMIAAMAIAGNHVLVTRNTQHFADLLPRRQLVNWLERLPD